MRYHSLPKAILEFLAGTSCAIVDGFLPPKYPEAKLARMLLGMDGRRRSRAAAKQTLSVALSRLKQQKLVARTGSKRYTRWNITSAGKKILQQTQPPEKDLYDLAPEDDIVRIVTFDIPEKIRGKRDWLREQLFACGYRLLQRSVFTGTRPLPDAFIQRVDKMRIGKYIHIAGIDKNGTLRIDAKRL